MNYKTRQPFPHAAYVEGQRNFTYFDRSLTSGLTDVVIESPGDFLYIDQASTGVVSVELNMRQGGTLAPILLAAGGSIECDFASFKINATAQLNKTVRIVVGNGARIKSGANVNPSSETVQVVNGGSVTAKASKGFGGYSYCAAVAAQYAHVQLFNPANATKNIYVETARITNYTSGLVLYGTRNVAMANLWGSGAMGNKLATGAVSTGQLRYEADAVQRVDYIIGALFAPVSTTVSLDFQTPICLPPGYGFVVAQNTVNQAVTCSFEATEE